MAPTARQIALQQYRRQQRIVRRSSDRVQELWRLLDLADLSGSWDAGIGSRMAATVAAAQLASAELANDYVDEVVEAEGADPIRSGRARAAAFAGAAADGRPLESLMYLSVISTKQGIAGGMSVDDALMTGLRQALRLSSSEVTQAGRGATGVSMAGKRTIQGYVRVVQPPACGRCIILAGTEWGWNKGFQRHPKCDCIHLPTTLIARNQGAGRRTSIGADEFSPTTRPGSGRRGFIDPHAYFNRLSRAEQDRVFTAAGARAIREGGDIYAIVNARRGMYTTTTYGRTVRATREGTTRRGSFYRSERARDIARGRVPGDIGRGYRLTTPRLLPEEIFELAESRDEAIAMLRRFGYLT
ncbi:hypothetical protein [Streptomyces sp. NPDC059828]|uniref:VG15 protein n=1 Tax=Streptomyces sp. NPDC059828 TaxID=3346965 RepID=UPI0036669433